MLALMDRTVDNENFSGSTQVYCAALGRCYNTLELVQRDKFVKAFHETGSGVAAASQLGHSGKHAEKISAQFLREDYVLSQIAQTKANIDQNIANREYCRAYVVKRAYELSSDGSEAPHQVQLGALKLLAELHSLKEKDDTATPVGPRGGVMLVPAGVDIEVWEKEAMLQQNTLLGK